MTIEESIEDYKKLVREETKNKNVEDAAKHFKIQKWLEELKEIKDKESENLSIMKKAVNIYGGSNQVGMAYEEMGELISALNKYSRGRISYMDVCTEIADVQIMMQQLTYMFGEEKVKSEFQIKLDRLKSRLLKHGCW